MDLLTPQAWHDKGQHFNYLAHDIFYQEAGKGECLICLHGFPTSSWDWYKVWNELSKDFHVIAPDFIGFGFSEKPQEYQYSILDQADLIELLLEKKKFNNIHILAHDYGDTVTQELLARHQDRVQFREDGVTIKSVCFLNGGLFPEAHKPKMIQKALMGPMGRYVSKFINEKKLTENLKDIFGQNSQPTEKELKHFWNMVTYNKGTQIGHKLIRYMTERNEYRDRWVGTLQKNKVPIRFVNGLEDPISGKNMVKRYREIIPRPDVVELEGIGHYPQIEAPEAVLNAFREFQENIKIV